MFQAPGYGYNLGGWLIGYRKDERALQSAYVKRDSEYQSWPMYQSSKRKDGRSGLDRG